MIYLTIYGHFLKLGWHPVLLTCELLFTYEELHSGKGLFIEQQHRIPPTDNNERLCYGKWLHETVQSMVVLLVMQRRSPLTMCFVLLSPRSEGRKYVILKEFSLGLEVSFSSLFFFLCPLTSDPLHEDCLFVSLSFVSWYLWLSSFSPPF